MKKFFFIAILLFFAFFTQAQKDTSYFKMHDSYPTWVAATKDSAEFFCILPFEKIDSLFLLKYYYANGNLLEEGFSENMRGSKKQGKYFYYAEDGRKTKEENYTDGYLDGKQLSFFKDGTIQTSGTRKNKQWQDGTILFDDGAFRGINEYKNGKQIGAFRFYSDSKQVATKLINRIEGQEEKLDFNNVIRIFYDRAGNEIGRYKTRGGVLFGDGIKIDFYYSDDLVYVNSVRSIHHYVAGKKEGQAIFYHKDGSVRTDGIFKAGLPVSGSFMIDHTLKNFEAGIQVKEEILFDSNGEIFIKGFLENGKPWNGQFSNRENFWETPELRLNFQIRDNVINTFVEGRLEGKQTFFRYPDDFDQVHFYVHIKNGKLNGEAVIFDWEGKEISKGIYKENAPWEGTFYDGRTRKVLRYVDGVVATD